MIVEIFVAESDSEDSLRKEVAEGMLDALGSAIVTKSRQQPVEETKPSLRRREQDRTAVRADRAATEINDHFAPAEGSGSSLRRDTLCNHKIASVVSGLEVRNALCTKRG